MVIYSSLQRSCGKCQMIDCDVHIRKHGSPYWQHFNSSLSLKFLARWNLIGKQRLWSLAGSFSSCLHCWPLSYRNWYVDEPSCGSEVCVVMYHQPSAPAGIGGPYTFQWNDDRCTMKNNFICKYSDGNESSPKLCGCILSLLSPFIISCWFQEFVT